MVVSMTLLAAACGDGYTTDIQTVPQTVRPTSTAENMTISSSNVTTSTLDTTTTTYVANMATTSVVSTVPLPTTEVETDTTAVRDGAERGRYEPSITAMVTPTTRLSTSVTVVTVSESTTSTTLPTRSDYTYELDYIDWLDSNTVRYVVGIYDGMQIGARQRLGSQTWVVDIHGDIPPERLSSHFYDQMELLEYSNESPDGLHVAFGVGDDLWIADAHRTKSRLLTDVWFDEYLRFAGPSTSWSVNSQYFLFHVRVDNESSGGIGTEMQIVNVDYNIIQRFENTLYGEWSPDGRHIFYYKRIPDEAKKAGFTEELWIADVDGSSHQLLTDQLYLDESLAGIRVATWSPDARNLLYYSLVEDENSGYVRTQLWIADVYSGELRRIEDGEYAKWSPDGRYFSYYSLSEYEESDNEDIGIWIASADNSSYGLLTNARYSRWSPDGENVAYLVTVEDETSTFVRDELWIADADGSNRRLLDDGKDDKLEPDLYNRRITLSDYGPMFDWSPNSRYIVYQYWDWGITQDFPELWTVDISEAIPRKLEGGAFYSTAWSPDGRYILYYYGGVWVADGDGTDSRELTSDGYGPIDYASWSPDGEQIVYRVVARDENDEITRNQVWLESRDGSNRRQLPLPVLVG